MAAKNGLFRLLARVSRVFVVIVKYAVMLLSRTRVTVGWGGIWVVDQGSRETSGFYLVYHWEFSPSSATGNISHIAHPRCDVYVPLEDCFMHLLASFRSSLTPLIYRHITHCLMHCPPSCTLHISPFGLIIRS
jgi:hypothetical protein